MYCIVAAYVQNLFFIGQAIPAPHSGSGERSDLAKYNCDISDKLRESIKAKNIAYQTRSKIYEKSSKLEIETDNK